MRKMRGLRETTERERGGRPAAHGTDERGGGRLQQPRWTGTSDGAAADASSGGSTTGSRRTSGLAARTRHGSCRRRCAAWLLDGGGPDGGQ
ncbi:hypothetical protein Syun_027840 [Stephania yunnanensis]|uniref:Uncharacterized protein n=1 Tax=Stephania yunnanensis TaxID=152371 RepID=A0AAP0EGN2_9MAGN